MDFWVYMAIDSTKMYDFDTTIKIVKLINLEGKYYD